MLNMLNMTVWEYLKENVVLTVAIVVILALIIALSGVMIYLQIKAKKTPSESQTEDKPEGEAPSGEPEPKEEAPEEPKQEEAQAESEEQPEAEEKKEEEKKEEEGESRWNGFRDGKWIVRKTKEGKFVFKLYAANGSVMLDSNKEYSTLSSAKNGIETYKKNIEDTNNCKIVSTKAGHFVYRITYANGMLLAVSSNYTSKASCENALELTRKYAAGAPVEVITD